MVLGCQLEIGIYIIPRTCRSVNFTKVNWTIIEFNRTDPLAEAIELFPRLVGMRRRGRAHQLEIGRASCRERV